MFRQQNFLIIFEAKKNTMKKFIYTILIISGLTVSVNAQTKKDPKPAASPKGSAAPVAKPTDKPKTAASPGVAVPEQAAEKPAEKPIDPSKLSAEEIQKIYTDYATPGEPHVELANMTGTWNEIIKIWMAPGTEPMVNKAVCSVEMILGERYQQSRHKGEFNGMPFEGIGITGYDNADGRLYSTWIDNMGTGIMFSKGTIDEKTGNIIFNGEQMDPITKKMMRIREVMRRSDNGNFIMEMYTTPVGGKEFLSMEITMVKVK